MASLKDKHVLLVEDDASIRSIVTEVLSDEGYVVAAACNGREALEYLRNQPAPGLVLLDMVMPVMSGWEFLSEHQQDPRVCDVPVLVLSGDRDIVRRVKRFRIVGCVDKPVRIDPLLDAVASHYGKEPVASHAE